MSKPTVAICIAIEERRRWLVEDRMIRQWNAIDLGECDGLFVLGAHDASVDFVQAFEKAARWPVVVAPPIDIDSIAKPPEDASKPRVWKEWAGGYAYIATVREAIRRCAIATGADWHFMLDCDVTPAPDGFLRLHRVLTKTNGPLAPQVVSGVVGIRPTGQTQAIPLPWKLIPAQTVAYVHSLSAGSGGPNPGAACLLMPGEVADSFAWNRLAIDLMLEHRRTEDSLIFQGIAERYGIPPAVDTGVVTKHYLEDGSYITFEPTRGQPAFLQSVYRRDEPTRGKPFIIGNSNAQACSMALGPKANGLTLAIPPHGRIAVAPEIGEYVRRRQRTAAKPDGPSRTRTEADSGSKPPISPARAANRAAQGAAFSC